MSSSILEPPQPFHPESKALIDQLTRLNLPPYNKLTLEQARARSFMVSTSVAAGEFEFNGSRSELFIPIPGSSDTIPVYVYKPADVALDPPILVYYHGGGMVVGCRQNVEKTCQSISSAARCIVVNVEYRLAPEHKFPIFVDDSCAVARWVLDNKTVVGGSEKSKIGVAGDSAGGTLSSSIAHEVPGLAFQILVYPRVLALGDYSLKSYDEYKDGPIIARDLIEWFETNSAERADYNNPRLASILRSRFDHLPPTLFIAAECDPIRDDSYEYAKKLTAAGVAVEFHLIKGAIHGFYTLSGTFKELTQDAYAKTVNFINKWGF